MQIDHKIAVIGLGYVGLHLAWEFAKKYPFIDYDMDLKPIIRQEERPLLKILLDGRL